MSSPCIDFLARQLFAICVDAGRVSALSKVPQAELLERVATEMSHVVPRMFETCPHGLARVKALQAFWRSSRISFDHGYADGLSDAQLTGRSAGFDESSYRRGYEAGQAERESFPVPAAQSILLAQGESYIPGTTCFVLRPIHYGHGAQTYVLPAGAHVTRLGPPPSIPNQGGVACRTYERVLYGGTVWLVPEPPVTLSNQSEHIGSKLVRLETLIADCADVVPLAPHETLDQYESRVWTELRRRCDAVDAVGPYLTWRDEVERLSLSNDQTQRRASCVNGIARFVIECGQNVRTNDAHCDALIDLLDV